MRFLIDGQEALGRIFRVAASARKSLWVTVSFVEPTLRVPAFTTTVFEFFQRLSSRGVDVRLLFWWSEYRGIGSFRGEPEQLVRLQQEGFTMKMRWDRVPRGCHHQKSYVVDGRTAFVGGINLNREALSSGEHEGPGFHDLFAELHGPVVADVAENFIQRWNQATETAERGHAFPSLDEADDISSVPDPQSSEAGQTPVQILRTIRRGLYNGRRGWRGDGRFDLTDGESSIHDAMLGGIAAAEHAIYIENQFLIDPETIAALSAAARRGVEIIAVVPQIPDANLALYPQEKLGDTRAALDDLGKREQAGVFALVRGRSPRVPIYVHSKLMIIDDRVLTLGSANLWPPSYFRDSELNLWAWDPPLARRLRERLWEEHLCGRQAENLADWRYIAAENELPGGAADTPITRVIPVDLRSYYNFEQGLPPPWRGIEPQG